MFKKIIIMLKRNWREDSLKFFLIVLFISPILLIISLFLYFYGEIDSAIFIGFFTISFLSPGYSLAFITKYWQTNKWNIINEFQQRQKNYLNYITYNITVNEQRHREIYSKINQILFESENLQREHSAMIKNGLAFDRELNLKISDNLRMLKVESKDRDMYLNGLEIWMNKFKEVLDAKNIEELNKIPLILFKIEDE